MPLELAPDKGLEELASYRTVSLPYRTSKGFRIFYEALRERFPSRAAPLRR